MKSNHLLLQQTSTVHVSFIGNINITNMFTKRHKGSINSLTAVLTLLLVSLKPISINFTCVFNYTISKYFLISRSVPRNWVPRCTD